MGQPTITPTEWGFYVTGDTDLSDALWSGRKYVQNITFVPNAAADTTILSTSRNLTGPYTNAWSTASAGVAGVAQNIRVESIPLDNLKVKLSDAGGKVYVYLRAR
jgi:hypothetical protein